MEASERVDTALGFVENQGKRQLFGVQAVTRRGLRAITDDPKQIVTRFVLLGVIYSTTRALARRTDPKKFQKAKRRLKRIRAAGQTKDERASLVRQVAMPIVAWSGAWCRPRKEALTRFTSAIEYTVCFSTIGGRSRYLLWSVSLDPTLNPEYMLSLKALEVCKWRANTSPEVLSGKTVHKLRANDAHDNDPSRALHIFHGGALLIRTRLHLREPIGSQ